MHILKTVIRAYKINIKNVSFSEIEEVTRFLAQNYWSIGCEPIGTITHKALNKNGQFIENKSIKNFLNHSLNRQHDSCKIIRDNETDKITAFGNFSLENLPMDVEKMKYLWLNDVNFELVQSLGLFDIQNQRKYFGKKFLYLGILCRPWT